MQEDNLPGQTNRKAAHPFAWLLWILGGLVLLVGGLLMGAIGIGVVLGDPAPGTAKGNIKPFLVLIAAAPVSLAFSLFCFVFGVIKAFKTQAQKSRPQP